MTTFQSKARKQAEALIPSRDLFRSMGVDGVRAGTALYEDVIDSLSALITRLRPDEAVAYRFPPVMSRDHIERNGYRNGFSQLLGCVSCLGGAAKLSLGAEEPTQAVWDQVVGSVDLVLTPASCYPLYPIVASEDRIPNTARIFDVQCHCFRNEPSLDLDRLQSFRMREFVCIGSAEQTEAFQRQWMSKAANLADDLGLQHASASASDPFFGAGASFLKAKQKAEKLKYELLVPGLTASGTTACMSFNLHREHFSGIWGIEREEGGLAQTACTAFGLDRLALALFTHHGLETCLWPDSAKRTLGL